MLRNPRKPVTYGKATRRYLLSESQDEPKEGKLWREHDSPTPRSPSASPEAGHPPTGPDTYDFDFPDSDDGIAPSQLNRPVKKRKLTPPESKGPDSLCKPSALQHPKKLARKPAPIKALERPVSSNPREFDFPSSDEERPQLSGKVASSLVKRPVPAPAPIRSAPPARPDPIERRRSPSAQLNVEASPRRKQSSVRGLPKQPPKKRDAQPQPGSKILVGDIRGDKLVRTLSHKKVIEIPLDSQASSEKQSSRPQSKVPKRPHTPTSQRRGGTDDEIAGPLSGVPKALITPGALNMTELNMNDTPGRPRSRSPEGVVMRDAPPDTPRRKLKDRLVRDRLSGILGMDASFVSADGEISATGTDSDKQVQSRLMPAVDLKSRADGEAVDRPDGAESLLGRRKVTYGRQRSHLAETQQDDDVAWSIPLDDELQGSQSRRLQIPGFDDAPSSQKTAGEESEDEEITSDKPLRSVHELRAAGGARRTGLLLDAIFDDVQAAKSIGSARGAMFRLASKLLEPTFPEEFVRHGSLTRLFSLDNYRDDRFVGSAYTVCLLRVLSLAPVAELQNGDHVYTLIGHFSSQLNDDTPLVKACRFRKSNMSRMHQSDIADVCRQCPQSFGLEGLAFDHVSSRLLALSALETCVRRLRRAGYMRKLVDESLFSTLGNILQESLEEAESETTPISTTRNVVSLLESLTVGEFLNHPQSAPALEEHAAAAIAASLPTVMRLELSSPNTLLSLALRLYLNVTTKSPSSCELFASDENILAVNSMIKTSFELAEQTIESEKRDPLVDHLVLGLGFLTNLTEEVPRCRATFLQPTIGKQSALGMLLGIFQAKNERAASAVTESETKVNVALGYLAVLLCSLCLDANVRQQVATELKDRTLRSLREALAQFVIFHRSIDMDQQGTGDATDSQSAFVVKLEQVLSELNAACIVGRPAV